MVLHKWFGLLLLMGLAFTGCKRANNKKQGAATPPPPPPPPVSVAAVLEREVKDWDEFTGRLEAVERVDVRPRVAGFVNSIHFKEGGEVKKGDLLFVIDPRPFEAELSRAQAALESAMSRASLARSQLKRSTQLAEDKFIAKEGLDERQSASQEANANIRAAQAAVTQARLNLEYTRVRAPIGGRVGRVESTVGNMVQAGPPDGTLLTTIVSLDPMYVYFDGDEQVYLKYSAQARAIAAQGKAEARYPIFMGLSNEQGFPHEGYVDFVDNRLDPATGTIRTRAVFSNKDRLFAPGLFARIKVAGGGAYRALLINERAVGTDQSQKFVLVVGADNKANRRTIKLGPIVDGLRVVRDGLKPGEAIVVNGLQRVFFPGMQVTPQKVPMEGEPPAAGTPAEQKKG
jgi:RND family efflux transporter MFP subunit